MAQVFSKADGERTIFPNHDTIGWAEYRGFGRVSVMWHTSLQQWLHARELECLGLFDQADMLWKMGDPLWGLMWSQNVKHKIPISLPISEDPDGKKPVIMDYQGDMVVVRNALPREFFWLIYPDASKEQVIWEGTQWVTALSAPYQHA